MLCQGKNLMQESFTLIFCIEESVTSQGICAQMYSFFFNFRILLPYYFLFYEFLSLS